MKKIKITKKMIDNKIIDSLFNSGEGTLNEKTALNQIIKTYSGYEIVLSEYVKNIK